MTSAEKLEYLTDDGLLTPEVGSWAEEKYRYVAYYNELFSTSMKEKWDCRVYIDLFAGAGRSIIRNTNKILIGSPLLALNVTNQYDKYIFCEKEDESFQALQARIEGSYEEDGIKLIHGDCNESVGEILAAIPKHSSKKRVLSFCFIDPYNISINFETVSKLSNRFMDFLIVLALGMDAQRNVLRYEKDHIESVDRFLGISNWRKDWEKSKAKGIKFKTFLATKYAAQMATLGYTGTSLEQMKEMRSNDKNLPLYYLAFFSRHPLGLTFWSQARKYGTDQPELPFKS